MTQANEPIASSANVLVPATKQMKPRCIRTNVALAQNRIVPVYAGKRIAEALQEVTETMNIYKGVRLAQVLEAVYDQGKKDGARSVFDSVDSLRREIPHRNPGQPKKKQSKAKH